MADVVLNGKEEEVAMLEETGDVNPLGMDYD